MAQSYDAIIIGGGHNGLTCGAYLAKAGLKTLVLKRRPVPHVADYRSPIAGLYQCGASSHPGGGVSGVPGHNAAREILKDLRR
ncbi:MAG: NAD(P)-binding protein [Planctomycetota bacterium]|jgi:phytoene dehydrogenase-like protein